jgi:hypothetical protein
VRRLVFAAKFTAAVVAIVMVLGGLGWFLNYVNRETAVARQRECRHVAELAGTDEYVEKSGTCWLTTREGQITSVQVDSGE